MTDPGMTHWYGCERVHLDCCLRALDEANDALLQCERDALAETEQLVEQRDELRRLGDALAEGAAPFIAVIPDRSWESAEECAPLRDAVAAWRDRDKKEGT